MNRSLNRLFWVLCAVLGGFVAMGAVANLDNFNRQDFAITQGGAPSNVVQSSTWRYGIHPSWALPATYLTRDPDIFSILDLNGTGEDRIQIFKTYTTANAVGVDIDIRNNNTTNAITETEGLNIVLTAKGTPGTNGFYKGFTAVGLSSDVKWQLTPTDGTGIGMIGHSLGAYSTGIGMAGVTLAGQDNMTNIGGAFASLRKIWTNITEVGVYAEVGDATANAPDYTPQFRSAAVLAENKGSGLPFFLAQINGVATTTIDGLGRLVFGTRLFFAGSGSPESSVTAPVGSLYMRTDGASGTTLYTKVSGTGNTGWEPVGGGDQIITNLTVNNTTIFNGKVTIANNANIETMYAAGNTNVIDLSIASATNTISSAITFAHATNGLASAQRIHDRWFYVASGGPYTLTIPSTWRTNVYSAVPPSLTNSTITRMVVTGMGDTSTSAAQTNALVSFEFYK